MIVLVVRPIGGDHGTVNPRVGGSSPPGGAFQILGISEGKI